MGRECVDHMGIVNVGGVFVTKWGDVRVISVFDSGSGTIGIKPIGKNEVIVSTVDRKEEVVDPMRVTTNFTTMGGRGCTFDVCVDVPNEPTPTPTPVPEEIINITIDPDSYGNVELYSIMYWQEGMPGWANIPTKIQDKPTHLLVYWKSTVDGDVCGYAKLWVNNVNVSPTKGDGQCVTLKDQTKAVEFKIDQLSINTHLNLDVCDTEQCPPVVLVCRKGCIPGTFTELTGKFIDGKCEEIPNSPNCGYVGFIKCQAYDSVSNAGLNTTVQIDGVTVVPKTPFTTQELAPGDHTVTFILEGYATKTVTVTVKAGETVNAYGSMVKETIAEIRCASVPALASIHLDGKNTLQFTPHILKNVSSGIHTITYYKTGYEPTSRVITAIAGEVVDAYAPMFLTSARKVKMRVYIQSGVQDVNEDTFNAFIKKVSAFYKSKGINIDFIVSELIWSKRKEPASISLSNVDVVLVVGEGVGHFVATIQRVGANLLDPFKFTQQGVVVLAHEFGHYFGLIDQYWLNLKDGKTPLLSNDTMSSIMYYQYTLTNGFTSLEKQILNINISNLLQGDKSSILYPRERWSRVLKIYIGKYNEPCKIFASERDYSLFNSSFPTTPTLTKNTDSDGFLIIDIQATSNRVEFDMYRIECGGWNIWINSIILDQNFIENGVMVVCNARYLNDTQWCELAEPALPDVPGFDVKVNIPGLLPRSSLHIEQVVKVPFTDTWWDSPIGHAIRWNNISNGVYKARGRSADSDPTPDYHVGFDENEDYAVYVGTSAVAFYPGSIVHRSTGKVTEIDLTSSYIDWVSSKVCATFGITPANCPFFIAGSVNDAAFLLELWSIITKHENLAGEHTLPSALDYALVPVAIFGLFSPGISEGAIASMIGKRFGKLIELSKKGAIDVKEIAQDERLSTFMLRATESQFGDLILYLEEGNLKTARILLGAVENITPTNMELNALDRAVKLTKKTSDELSDSGSVEPIQTIFSRFSKKFAEVYTNAVKWATAHPFESVTIGIGAPALAAIVYIIDNSSINYEQLVKSKGIKTGDTSWTAKSYIDVIDTYMFNVKDAEKAQDWDAFCENLALWKAEVDKLKVFLLANGTTLRAEGTYDVLESSIQAYYKAIEIKEKVYTCAPTALPESIDAEVMEILDSDTVKIRYEGSDYTVRLLGINAPEGKTYDYTCTGVRSPFLIRRLVTPGKECIEEETWTGTEELYNASKVWLGQNLPVHQIAKFYSDSARQFDKYGRLLASPFYNNKYVCNASLAAGMSVVFFYDFNKHVNRVNFLVAEGIAKNAKIGVWALEAGTGTIRCVSYPTAAEVWLDGTYTGKKTISNVAILENIAVGPHEIEFRKIIDNVQNSCSKEVIVVADISVTAECTLSPDVVKPTPEPTPLPGKAIWQIGEAKNSLGVVLGSAKVFVDNVYIGHYAPELITFCDNCFCDNVVSCGFGSHTVTIKRTGYVDWVKTRTLKSGDSFLDNPVLQSTPEDTFPVVINSVPNGAIISIDGIQV